MNREADDRSVTNDDSAHGVATRRDFLWRTAAGAAVLSGSSGLLAANAAASPFATPTRGGTLRVAIAGGGASETLNPNHQPSELESAYQKCVFERLVGQAPNGSLFNQLAQELSANKAATVWRIKLRPGVEWHDGSAFTADDVVYTFKYILDPANTADGANDLGGVVTPANIRKIDNLTVEFRLSAPLAILPAVLSSRALYIFKNGTTNFDAPIGTGPFKFVTWKQGESRTLARFANYRTHGGPYLDQVQLVSISDPQARYNALAAGQVDAIADLDFSLVSSVRKNSKLRVLNTKGGQTTVQCMWCDAAPFNDKRVRQAFRLMLDRKQLVNVALQGYGSVGNDLLALVDPDYAHELPQRQHDPEKAKALLKAAGHANLSVTLTASQAAPAAVTSSTLIAQQAKKAGVKVKLEIVPADQYWTTAYMKRPFQISQWAVRSLDTYIAYGYARKAVSNETHWRNAKFDALWHKTRATLNAKQRHAGWVDLQEMLWKDGGSMVWGFRNNVDGYSAKVNGLKKSVVRPLGYYDFTDVYLT